MNRATKRRLGDFAAFGGPAAFAADTPVGQLYFPDWHRYARAMSGIFEREYYTNHGPLAHELEEALQDFLGVKNAICVSNGTVGLMMAVKALELTGDVLVPAFTFPATAQAILWGGARPRFCDVGFESHQLEPADVEAALSDRVQAIFAVNLWGDTCDVRGLQNVSEQAGIPICFDSAHAFGCCVDGEAVGRFGSLEVFSFHATKVLSTTEGGCLTTDNDELAARLRNIRSSYGAGRSVPVPITANGRFSEAQAALGLLSLEDLDAHRDANRRLFRGYRSCLDGIPGLELKAPGRVSLSNYQFATCVLDEARFGVSRDMLLAVLKAENVNARRYFYPGAHRIPPFVDQEASLPTTDRLCDMVLQLPLGSTVTEGAVEAIASLLESTHAAAPAIAEEIRRVR